MFGTVITIIMSASCGAFFMAIFSAAIDERRDLVLYEKLVAVAGKTAAGQLWPLIEAGQISIFDVKVGVYTIQERTEIQRIYEEYRRHENNR